MHSKEYDDQEIVLMVGYPLGGEKMRIVGAVEHLKGWRYELAFLKKDGTTNKRKAHRFFYSDRFKKI